MFHRIEADRLFCAQWGSYNLVGRVKEAGELENNAIVPAVLEASAAA